MASNLPYLIIEDEIMNLILIKNMNMKVFKPHTQKKYFISTCLLGCFALFLTSCATQKEEGCGFVTNNSGHRLSWNSSLPVTLWLHPTVPAEYRPSFYAAANIWEEEHNIDFFDIQELPEDSSIVPRRDNRSIIYWDEQWNGSKDKASEQAKTTIYWMGSQIIDSDIRFNAEEYGFYTDEDIDRDENVDNIFVKNKNQPTTQRASIVSFNIINHLMAFIEQRDFKANMITHASNILPSYINLRSIYINGVEQKSYYIHLESLAVHELGHTLGLDHKDEKDSVMQEKLSARTERDQIGESDYKSIECEYSSVM